MDSLASTDVALGGEIMSTRTGICHVGIQARDPQALAEFYRDVLGMAIVGGSAPDSPLGATALLSIQPGEEDHEIAIFADPRFRHIAFRAASLTALRSYYGNFLERGLPIKQALNHGVSLSFYFDDPAGNMVEVYWATGVPYPQPPRSAPTGRPAAHTVWSWLPPRPLTAQTYPPTLPQLTTGPSPAPISEEVTHRTSEFSHTQSLTIRGGHP